MYKTHTMERRKKKKKKKKRFRPHDRQPRKNLHTVILVLKKSMPYRWVAKTFIQKYRASANTELA